MAHNLRSRCVAEQLREDDLLGKKKTSQKIVRKVSINLLPVTTESASEEDDSRTRSRTIKL